jgi:cellulase/cellobiase CelA1
VSATTAAQQVTATHPITDLNIILPIAAPPPVVSQGTPSVTVNLTLNGADWQNGYCRNLVVKNTNNYPVTWSVHFSLPFSGKIDPNNYWNMTYTQSGSAVTASGIGWNNVLQPGQALSSSGFCASK